MIKVLVIGSKGFIGSRTYSYFSRSSGYDCYGCDVAVDYMDKRYFLIDATNSDFNDVFEKISFDVCINCSGAASVSDSLIYPLRDFNLNVFTVAKILEAIRNHTLGCKFINMSSAAVYGNPSALPVSVGSETKPLSPYGWHKLQSEMLCQEYFRFYGIQTISLRVFSAYGPGLRKQLFWDLFQKATLPGKVKIYGTGNESRDFIHVDDLVQVIELAVQNADFKGSVVNVANGQELFLKDIASLYLNFLDKTPEFTEEAQPGYPMNWVADISTILSWGYKNKKPLSGGLQEYIEWARRSG